MRSLILRLALLLLSAVLLRADRTLDHARAAQRSLGPEIWSQVIRVDNEGSFSRYPRRFHALVFEVANLLWFYTSIDGTQGFSLQRGRLSEEKADFGPLLRDIEPGLTRWQKARVAPARRFGAALPNACFVESVAALRALAAAGTKLERPSLLSYYVDVGGVRRGHTVLAFEDAEDVRVFDPAEPGGGLLTLAGARADDALPLARALDERVTKAHLIPLDGVYRSARIVAFAGGNGTDSKTARQFSVR